MSKMYEQKSMNNLASSITNLKQQQQHHLVYQNLQASIPWSKPQMVYDSSQFKKQNILAKKKSGQIYVYIHQLSTDLFFLIIIILS